MSNPSNSNDNQETSASNKSLDQANHIAKRFRGYLPVVIDIETGGFNPEKDALLEIAAVILYMNDQGILERRETISCHVEPFKGANIEQEALDFNGINPYTKLRGAIPEKEAIIRILNPIRKALKETDCHRAILVGHNAHFDHAFLRAAIERSDIKRNPFHPFSSLDTVTLSAIAYGHTVLAESCRRAGIPFNNSAAHAASYDAERTADLFCKVINQWKTFGGWPFEAPPSK